MSAPALTAADTHALIVLASWTAGGAGMRPGNLGTLIWPKTLGNRGGFVRATTNVMRRLEAHHYAAWEENGFCSRTWKVTPLGLEKARELAAAEARREIDLCSRRGRRRVKPV